MKLELKRTEIEFDVYGTPVKATRPSVQELEAVYEELSTVDAKDARAVWCKLLVKHGFERSLLDSVEADHMIQIVDAMQGTKKKSPTTS